MENGNSPENTAENTASNQEETAETTPVNAENTAESQKETIEPPKKQQVSSSGLKGFTIKCYENEIERFKNLQTPKSTNGEFFSELLDNFENPKVETKEIEKTVEVEKQLPENSIVLQLSSSQKALLEVIQKNRAAKNLNQSIDQIILAMVFNPDRLANYDNAYYTGISKELIQKVK